MAGEKPIREMDTILVRVPDGLKQRIARRARSNGRSMSAEVLDILERTLRFSSTSRVRRLEEALETLELQAKAHESSLHEIRAKWTAVDEELKNQRLLNQVAAKHVSEDGDT